MAKNRSRNDSKAHPEKAYKNLEFLNSPAARTLRVLSELLEPHQRFYRQRIKDTIVFFGSARMHSRKAAEENLREAGEAVKKDASPANKDAYEKAKCALELSRYYEDAALLSEKLTKWSLSLPYPQNRFVIASGGGPGIMEAANLGAQRAGGKSIGLNISMPVEQPLNEFQTRELSFIFHYFFIRKFWFVYLAKALVVFPGGFGTLDELFEILTLSQTGKIKKKMSIVVYGSEYWKKLIDFDMMLKKNMLDKEDLALFRFFDDVDEAFKHLKSELTKNYLK